MWKYILRTRVRIRSKINPRMPFECVMPRDDALPLIRTLKWTDTCWRCPLLRCGRRSPRPRRPPRRRPRRGPPWPACPPAPWPAWARRRARTTSRSACTRTLTTRFTTTARSTRSQRSTATSPSTTKVLAGNSDVSVTKARQSLYILLSTNVNWGVWWQQNIFFIFAFHSSSRVKYVYISRNRLICVILTCFNFSIMNHCIYWVYIRDSFKLLIFLNLVDFYNFRFDTTLHTWCRYLT